MKYSFLAIIALLLGVSCTPKQQKQEPTKVYRFRYIQPPMQVVGEEQQFTYVRDHYWDKFDFADTLYTTKADTEEKATLSSSFLGNPMDRGVWQAMSAGSQKIQT